MLHGINMHAYCLGIFILHSVKYLRNDSLLVYQTHSFNDAYYFLICTHYNKMIKWILLGVEPYSGPHYPPIHGILLVRFSYQLPDVGFYIINDSMTQFKYLVTCVCQTYGQLLDVLCFFLFYLQKDQTVVTLN